MKSTIKLPRTASKLVFLVPAVLALWLVPPVTAVTFTDGFEGTSISSFWTATGSGTATLTDSISHSGSQSLYLTQATNFRHDFGSPQSGSVSVWIQGQQQCCGSAIGLQIEDDNPNNWLAVLQQAGNNNDPSSFVARVNGSPESDYFLVLRRQTGTCLRLRQDLAA
jgi:hypothetical protein